jgi:hypothetical protein
MCDATIEDIPEQVKNMRVPEFNKPTLLKRTLRLRS